VRTTKNVIQCWDSEIDSAQLRWEVVFILGAGDPPDLDAPGTAQLSEGWEQTTILLLLFLAPPSSCSIMQYRES
jgi:hypothetical protein